MHTRAWLAIGNGAHVPGRSTENGLPTRGTSTGGFPYTSA